jgi:hypothetical protein
MEQAPANIPVSWPATDGLGRPLPDAVKAGPPRKDRFVGIFYFLWSGQHNHGDKVYNVMEILEKHPDAMQTPASPPWGPEGAMHFWGEPLYGYYLNTDPWVLRRHAHLLADAGVDTLIFDTTNRVTYRDVYMKLCEVFAQVRKEGGRTPQIAFMCNTLAGETAQELYNDLYKPGHYPELWFHWQGKPLMVCDPKEASPEVAAFFTLRKAHWPFEQINTPYAWHWEAAYPQHYGYTTDPDVPEQVNVSVAQNLRQSDGQVTNMSRGDARGRSFHDGVLDKTAGAVNYGYNCQEQWSRAFELTPPFVMVTGWNEWIAGRYSHPQEPVVFVDQFDQEFSRDIEMVKGYHHDHYYYQLVSNVRLYKGCEPIPTASAPKTIQIDGDFKQWEDVGPAYRDHFGETYPRDHAGVCDKHYTNKTGRNEFLRMKVARDDQFLYFHAYTREPITDCRGPHWMMLLLDTTDDPVSGWEGYEFIVNRTIVDSSTSLLEKSRGGWEWQKVTEVRFRVEGNRLHLAVPREALALPRTDEGLRFDFKWVDYMQKPGDIMDLYLSGDTAPQGRFRYRYQVA